jgi:pimeloyl-[acyl-carrier protein] methyl ester esterase
VNRLFTRIVGAGPDLVLLHGWGLHSGVWNGIVERLAPRFRLMLVNLPGYGHSVSEAPSPLRGCDGWREAVTTHAYLDGAVAQLAEVAPARACWLGWSLGGMLALRFAADWPDRVEKLILVAASPRFTRAPDWPQGMEPVLLEQFARDLTEDYEGTLRRFVALQVRGSERARETQCRLRHSLLGSGTPDPKALRAGLGILRDADLRQAAAHIACPVLFIVGDRDTLVPTGLAVKRLMASAEWVEIPGVGHAPFLAHPDLFVQAVTGFLRG